MPRALAICQLRWQMPLRGEIAAAPLQRGLSRLRSRTVLARPGAGLALK